MVGFKNLDLNPFIINHFLKGDMRGDRTPK